MSVYWAVCRLGAWGCCAWFSRMFRQPSETLPYCDLSASSMASDSPRVCEKPSLRECYVAVGVKCAARARQRLRLKHSTKYHTRLYSVHICKNTLPRPISCGTCCHATTNYYHTKMSSTLSFQRRESQEANSQAHGWEAESLRAQRLVEAKI